MIKLLIALVTFYMAYLPMTYASPIVADLSNYRIHMDSSFNGTRMFLFGARNDNGDVVVVIRGPEKNYIVRKKEPFMGIWVNSERMKFFNVPDYYVIASSRPLEEIMEFGSFRKLSIGMQHLTTPTIGSRNTEKFQNFSNAFLAYQKSRSLYRADLEPISFMGETLFKTVVPFPDNIPSGEYTAEIYLLSEGDIIGMQSTPIQVMKTGIDAFVYQAAHQYPFLYGISAIIIALSAGWLGSRLFERKT